jgi:hypothetical protein
VSDASHEELSMNDPLPVLSESYAIASLQRSEPPQGAEGTDWHTYVITQGRNTIYGCRQGSHAVVLSEVEAIVVRLNERRSHKRGRTHVVLRGRKPAVKSDQA